MKAAGRTIVLGLLVGCSLCGLRWTQTKLRVQATERTQQLEEEAANGRVEEVNEATGSFTRREA